MIMQKKSQDLSKFQLGMKKMQLECLDLYHIIKVMHENAYTF